MTQKRDTNSTSSRQQAEMLGASGSVIAPQEEASTNLNTPEEQLERRSISPEW